MNADGGRRTFSLFRRWRKTKPLPISQTDFSASLRLIREDGWVYLELLLANRSDVAVWVEEVTVVLSELEASWQTTIATGQSNHAILAYIGSDDVLSVSLVGAIYDAAGRPQGKYSCLVFNNVRYRVGDEWINQTLDAYKVEMAALTVFRLRHRRWFGKKVRGTVPEPLPREK
jgi:hypothetical protein